MFTITCDLPFCYGHRLLNHEGKCKYLHGHNARAVVTLESNRLDDMGMVVDFGRVKEVVGGWINDHLDHKLLLSQADPLVPVLRGLAEPVYTTDGNPTAEHIARLIFGVAVDHQLPVTAVTLWETDRCSACYSKVARTL